ncbi:MAG: sigma-54-dependent Fis family transcriptional regulator [Bacteroidetes bacterium]|nr:sigma-54-dependent Fis family transcriptional regulator [Bacteroidota bacterium]
MIDHLSRNSHHRAPNDKNASPLAGRTHRHPVEFAFETSANPLMQDALTTIKRIAASHVNVLITGEHGTGKEWGANIIHNASPRAGGTLITVECAAIPPEELERELFGHEAITWKDVDIRPGAFETSSEGTLVLNEIGLVPQPLLMRIARAAEYQSVRRIAGENDIAINTRLIATMSTPPHAGPMNGGLPEEVLHRLSPIHVELVPLRKRREDIPFLVEGFLSEIQVRMGSTPIRISEQALAACLQFDWPGNLRHLRNAIEYASVMCNESTILPEHLPAYMSGGVRRG